MDVEDGSIEIKGDKTYFILEAVEREGGEYIWKKRHVDWCMKSVISITDRGSGGCFRKTE